LLPALNICHVGTILGDKKPAPLQAHQNFSSGPTKKNVSASSLEAHYFLTCSKHVAKVLRGGATRKIFMRPQWSNVA